MGSRLIVIKTLDLLDEEDLISDMLHDIHLTKISNKELGGTEISKSRMISIIICYTNPSSVSMVNSCIVWSIANKKDWHLVDNLILKKLLLLKSK